MTTKLPIPVGELKEPRTGKQYISVSLSVDDPGKPAWSIFTGWVRDKMRRPHIEVREAGAVIPEIQISHWRKLGEDYIITSRDEHLLLLYQIGGNALIELSLARGALSFLLEPIECRRKGVRGGVRGYVPAADLTRDAYQPAPTPRLRMQILARDQYRCRLCGERPSDNVHIVLHVHHIRPWSHGGPTTEDNLITLCGTCHGSLAPHFQLHLFEKIGGRHGHPSKPLFRSSRMQPNREDIRYCIDANSVFPVTP